jgi:hypothetical protein
MFTVHNIYNAINFLDINHRGNSKREFASKPRATVQIESAQIRRFLVLEIVIWELSCMNSGQ